MTAVGTVVVASGGVNVPSIDTREIATQVLVNDGQTVVLGGILETTQREDDTKVPYLGDIPVLGHLFKNTTHKDDKDELMIFITPKIVREGVQRPQLVLKLPRQCLRSTAALEAAVLLWEAACVDLAGISGYPVRAMTASSNLFLIGPMGSGKTAVGRTLARTLELPFHDSDAEIERRTGVDIPYHLRQGGRGGISRARARGDRGAHRAAGDSARHRRRRGAAAAEPARCWRPAAGWCTWKPRLRSRRIACASGATARSWRGAMRPPAWAS